MANKIQIKRSVSNGTVTGLSNGELAFTQVSNTLHIGLPDGGGVLRIGGAQYPGLHTNNHALVTNATGSIDKIIVETLYANNIEATSTVNATTLSVGGWVVANNSGVFTSGVVNGDIIRVGTYVVANTTKLALATTVGFQANGTIGSSGQLLYSNGTTPYWADPYISSFTAGNGLTGSVSGGSLSIDVGAGNGISVNSSAVAVNANNGIAANSDGTFVVAGLGVTVNSSGVNIGQAVETTSNVTFANVVTTDLTTNGNTTIGSSTSDIITINALVSSNAIPSANLTYHLGNNTLRWAQVHTGNLHAVTGTFDGNVSVSGDIFVTGNLVTTNVQSVVISDPMIYLAGNNYTSDLVDIGFAGNYNDGTDRHTGLFRDHVDGTWKLFYNLTQELSGNNDVDTNDASYRTATLQTYLISGGLTTNTSTLEITANSTYAVTLVANSLTLSTSLIGTSGGTGKSTVTNNALLVGNSTNGYNELTLGSSGYVLQSNGSALVYDILDGGVF